MQTTQGLKVVIFLSDGISTAEFEFENFLSKDYKFDGEHVRFGGIRMKLHQLCIHVGYKIIFNDLASITEPGLD
jgi:hypothetical protein